MSLKRFLLVRVGRVISYPVRRQLWRFEAACLDPEAVQAELLLRILRRQAGTAFGRDHHFADVRTVADYRRNVPFAPYEYVAPYIERVQKGETERPARRPARAHVRADSGTTASRKLIPVTDEYLAAYRRGWNMWGLKMYRDNRGRKVAMRPIVQMVGDPEEFRTEAGIPCGNLSGYTAMVQKRIIRWMYAVPYITGKIKDAKARYYVALRFSIGRNVSQFMAANPSTLVQFARTLDAEKEHLLRDLADGTLRSDLDIPGEVRDWLSRKLPRDPKRAAQLGKPSRRRPVALPDRRLAGRGHGHQHLDRRQHGAVPAATAAILRRAAAARPGTTRQRGPHDHPAGGRHLQRRARHLVALLRVHPGRGDRLAAADAARGA
jgi:hypothetical protein